MHILYVWSYWQYPQVALEFLNQAKSLGYKISVLLGTVKGQFNPDEYEGITFYFAPHFDFLSKVTGTPYPIFRKVKQLLLEIKPDLVHINSHLFFCNIQVARVARSLKIPFIVTVHGVMINRNLLIDSIQSMYLNVFGRWLFSNASAIICLTKSDALKTSHYACAGKISIIPNGVDIDFFNVSEKRSDGLIVWVGRMVPEKGLVYLLKAMPNVFNKFPEAKLVLAGDGICRRELEQLTVNLKISDKVTFLGSVDRVQVAKILSEANVFAFPSLKEGLPFSVLEAMSCGVPVVGSDIPGVRSIITHRVTGLLVPVEDSLSLRNAIIELLMNKTLREEIGANSRILIKNEYDISVIMKKIQDVYCNGLAN